MIERLTDEETIRRAEARLKALIETHAEWLYVEGASASASLRKGECDFHVSHGRLIFSCWTDKGLMVWRIRGWEWACEKLTLEASRRMGAQLARLELIPRATHEALSAIISDTRRERCYQLAQLACAAIAGAKVERAGLSAGTRKNQPGRYARILLRHHNFERIAVAGAISESGRRDSGEAFLSSTLLWFTRLSERTARPPYIQKLWLITGKDCVDALGKLVALLRDELRRVITLYEIDDERRELTAVSLPELNDLWKARARARLTRPPLSAMSESAARIVAHAPEAIDVIGARRGETLRYHGLPFARVRRVMDRESVWFGTEGARRLLDDSTLEDWSKLLRDLKEHRRADCPDKRHALYRASPEAWLESKLRRDITRLDPGLRLAPLYAQFRPGQAGKGLGTRPVDLLALRQDGRLAVIELKVSADREHVFQGADYWRRVEQHRRYGYIDAARLFGNASISEEPPLVYLVAPLLRFHRAFQTLARSLRPEIEIYRFDLGEDWRAKVRVVRRRDLTH